MDKVKQKNESDKLFIFIQKTENHQKCFRICKEKCYRKNKRLQKIQKKKASLLIYIERTIFH